MKSNVRQPIAVAVLLLAAVFTASCTRSADPVSASSGGSLIGSVAAYAVASPTLVKPNAISVTIEGSPYHTITDSLGNFRIDNIPPGVYTIVFSKPGFDSMIYPVHHMLGVGTDIINDAYIVQESSDSIALNPTSSVYKVSFIKTIHVVDTVIKEGVDTIIRSFDTTITTYDTASNPAMVIVSGKLVGPQPPVDLFVYSSHDSMLYPEALCPTSPSMTVNEFLIQHTADTNYHGSFSSPTISGGGAFADTIWADVVGKKPYTFDHGETIYIFIVGHSNTNGLPTPGGEYQHFFTVPYGPTVRRLQYVVP